MEEGSQRSSSSLLIHQRSKDLSRVALLNNIGALLMYHHEDSKEDAILRFKTAVKCSLDCNQETKCVWNTHEHEPDYQGLSWFYRKLQRDLEHQGNHHNATIVVPSSTLGLEYYEDALLASAHDTHLHVQAMAYTNWSMLVTEDADKKQLLQHAHQLSQDNPLLRSIIQNNLAVLQIHKSIEDGWQLLHQAQNHYDQIHHNHHSKLDITFLQITIWCNMARYAVRRNDPNKALALGDQITELYNRQYQYYNENCCKRKKWIVTVLIKYYIMGMANQRLDHFEVALECYNHFLQHARKEFGHDHILVGTVLQLKGSVLFEQRNLTAAMLAFLASLKIQEFTSPHNLERLLYQIARTLHDKEDYTDALHMYQRTLVLQKQKNQMSVQVLTTMCNIARIYYVLGDVSTSVKINEEIIQIATQLSGQKHPFVAYRLKVLGNMLVEVGRLEDAMQVFAKAARSGLSDAVTNFYDTNFQEDIETSSFAIQAAKTLSKVGHLHPHAACA